MKSKTESATGMLRWFVLATFFTASASAADDVCVQQDSTISSRPIIIKNPVLEDFGDWGQWDACPEGTFFAGFQLKFEQAERKYYRITITYDHYDNTVLNGIRFLCSKVGENRFTAKRPMSAVGQYGEWSSPLFCDIGAINGFQVRHAIYIGAISNNAAGRVDNMGAINVRVHCVKTGNRKVWLEDSSIQDPQEAFPEYSKLKNRLIWTEKQYCGPGQAVTAIRTQVDKREKEYNSNDASKTVDTMGLTNIEMRCVKIPTALDTCKPKLFYQQLLECNNIKGTAPLSCRYETMVGTQSSQVNRKTESNMRSILDSLGVDAEVKVSGVYTKMSSMISSGVDNGDTSTNETSEFWERATVSAATITVPENRVQRIFQVTGSCGDTEVRTSRIIVDERIGDVPNPIPKTGFVCADPRKGRGAKIRKFRALKHLGRSHKTYSRDEF